MTPLDLLEERGAGEIAHPGGTLLDHLVRVGQRLDGYGASPMLQVAGLTHAAYSTDGFDTALLTLDERPVLRDAIGVEAEELVYLYAASDRVPFYRQLGQPLLVWTDRFTRSSVTKDPAEIAPLIELTVANELDVVEHAPDVRAEYGASLLALFTRARGVMSAAAWADVERTL
ncbi:MAG: hypothetical protein JWO12_2114 [Frankiales bacterium]|nr:hypothetical protein [Frankiales bacterium]